MPSAMRGKPLISLLIATAFALALLGCLDDFTTIPGVSNDDGDGDVKDIFVVLFNDSDAAVHLLAPGENLSSGEAVNTETIRKVLLVAVERNEELIFRAGRDGTICQEVRCRVTDLDREDHEVDWVTNLGFGEQNENLVCINGLSIASQTIFDASCEELE